MAQTFSNALTESNLSTLSKQHVTVRLWYRCFCNSSVVVTVLVLVLGGSVTPAQQSMNFNISSGDTVTLAQDCVPAAKTGCHTSHSCYNTVWIRWRMQRIGSLVSKAGGLYISSSVQLFLHRNGNWDILRTECNRVNSHMAIWIVAFVPGWQLWLCGQEHNSTPIWPVKQSISRFVCKQELCMQG